MNLVRNPQVPEVVKQRFVAVTDTQLERLLEEKPGDARVHVFVGSYYRTLQELDKAAEQMALARQFSPDKQAIINQQGFIELSRGNIEESRSLFQTSFELDTRNLEAREYYAAALMYADRAPEGIALMDSEQVKQRFAASDFLISTANQFSHFDFVIELYEERVQTEPAGRQNWRTTPQTWASLAYLYYQVEDMDKALETLERAKEAVPAFASTADCFGENIRNGNDPQEGCS
jgi:tetratricopeptide (TPR) repeat protein